MTIEMDVTVGGCRRLADHSLSVSLHTCLEGTTEMVAQFDRWKVGGETLSLSLSLEGGDVPPPERKQPGGFVNLSNGTRGIRPQTPSQRLRLAIWHEWSGDGEFEPYYEARMEEILATFTT